MKPESVASNGHGNIPAVRLFKLLAEREADVLAIKRTIALMNGAASNGAGHKGASVIADALALDAARRAKKTKAPKQRGASRPQTRKAIKARRQRTVALLAQIAKTGEAPEGSGRAHGLGPLVRHGLIKKTRTGYARTDKPFEA